MTYGEQCMLELFKAQADELEQMNPDDPEVKQQWADLRKAVDSYLAERPHLVRGAS